METVNVHEAKTHLSRILRRVESGEEIVIARNHRPIARLVPVRDEPRRPGRLAGQIRIADDFDAPLPDEVLRSFLGG